MRTSQLVISALVMGAAFTLALLGTGCTTKPQARAGKTTAVAPADPGTPATASGSSSVATLPVPTGSSVETTPATAEAPAAVRVVLAAPSELRVESRTESASSGTVDTTVAVKKAELSQTSADLDALFQLAATF